MRAASTLLASFVALNFAQPDPAAAQTLYRPGGWSAMASDRLAEKIGDSLTVLIAENASATNSADNGEKRSTRLGGSVGLTNATRRGQLDLNSNFDGAGQAGRSGKMVAQISVIVDEVLPNGDLRVSGEQSLRINGDDTRIRLKGRVRRADITSANTVVSTRLADAMIDYNGSGFVSRSARPGLLSRIFNTIGLP